MSPKRKQSLRVRPIVSMFRTDVCSKCGCEKRVLNGAYLRAERERQQLSLRTVASMANLSAAFLSDVENNRRNASERALLAYVHAGVIATHVMGGQDQ